MTDTPGQQQVNQREWESADNWTLPVGFYFSKRDSRWLVPKKNPVLGWTFNLGTSKGAWALLASFLFPILVLTGTLLALAFTR